MPVQLPSHFRRRNAISTTGDRFAMWVDGVGGYLVCLRDSVVLGQASPDSQADVAFQADIKRQHAVIRRQAESYVIEPLGLLKIDGRVISGPTRLSDGEEIQLGAVVRVRFRQPHPLSATARLDLVSPHRPRPGVDAVLLMSESCVLGPRWQNHVVCRDWTSDLVLARQSGQLFCRAMQPLEIDGETCDGRGKLTFASRVSGEDFALCKKITEGIRRRIKKE